ALQVIGDNPGQGDQQPYSSAPGQPSPPIAQAQNLAGAETGPLEQPVGGRTLDQEFRCCPVQNTRQACGKPSEAPIQPGFQYPGPDPGGDGARKGEEGGLHYTVGCPLAIHGRTPPE